MTLHVYSEARGHRTLLMGIEFNCLCQLESVFEKFRAATGVRLSEYDDAVLGRQHLALLNRLLKEVSHTGGLRSRDFERFAKVVEDAVKAASDLVFVGE